MGCFYRMVIFVIFSLIWLTPQSFCYDRRSTLMPGDKLRDWEQLVSESGLFMLGFFSTQKGYILTPEPRYIGIWSRASLHPVWVGNPTAPVPDSSGSLTIDGSGVLKITQANAMSIILNTGARVPPGSNISATLLNSGNFVVRLAGRDGVPRRILWQSFDYPSDQLLPGMKLGLNRRTGRTQEVASWTSEEVPSHGAFHLGLDPNGGDQLVIFRRDKVYWSSGVLTNGSFPNISFPLSEEYLRYELSFGHNENSRYFSYNFKNKMNNSVLSWWFLDSTGQLTAFTYVSGENSSTIIETFNYCSENSTTNPEGICIKEEKVKCRRSSDYFKLARGFASDPFTLNVSSTYGDYNTSLGFSDCHGSCWKNCSCVGFKPAFSDGTGCLLFGKDTEITEEPRGSLMYLLTSDEH